MANQQQLQKRQFKTSNNTFETMCTVFVLPFIVVRECVCLCVCVGILLICFTVIYCVFIVCTEFLYCFIYAYIFLFITSVRTTATE
jgi:uncharacterized membrane protein